VAGVELIRVSKRFGDLAVLEDVTLDIKPLEFVAFLGPSGCGKSTLLRIIAGLEYLDDGEVRIGAEREFMVLLGPSGCGKSTVLRMIAGLEPITSGTVSIDGRVMNAVPAKARDIAMVFQSYALYPHMSVFDNLAFGLRRRDVDGDEIARRVRAAADKLRLTELLNRKPHALSGGQRQRVALGRAIVRDPKVFLFDEPLSNLDAALRVSTRNELIRQQQDIGTTTIYVTHDQVEAMTMGHCICIMNHGKVVQVGRPLEVYRKPADAFVARFLGNPPMNLVNAMLEARDGAPVVRLGRTDVPLSPAIRSALDARRGGEIVLGIRPEDLYERPLASGTTVRLGVRVVAVEPLGAETLVVTALDGSQDEIIARLGRDTTLRPGDRIEIALDTAAIHLFDPLTTKAISGS
jgi:multiple sugar transport system ATP-binding protein